MKKNRSNRSGVPQRDTILQIYFDRKSPRAAIYQLKTSRSYSQAKNILKKIGMTQLQRDVRRAIIGVYKTDDWNEVLSDPVLPNSGDFIHELGWLAHGFRYEADDLKSFIENRKVFGKAYLLGDYETATASLKAIRERHGLSLWLAEREFMLLQAKEGFSSHKAHLSSIQSTITNALVGYFATTISNRLEPHVTPESFSRSTQQTLSELRDAGHAEFASLVELHVSPWSFSWKGNRAGLLQYCTGKVLIDSYDRAMKVIACLSSDDISEENQPRLIQIIEDLYSAVEDRQLAHLLTILGQPNDGCDWKSEEYFNALDSLVEGRYEECVNRATSLLLDDPTCFDFYWLLARAMACSSKSIDLRLPESCFARQIVENLYKIAENQIIVTPLLSAIYTFSLKLGDNHLGISLWQFAQYEELRANIPEAAAQAQIQSKIDCSIALLGHYPESISNDFSSFNPKYHHHASVQLAIFEQNTQGRPGCVAESVAVPFSSIARAKRAAAAARHSEVLVELSIFSDSSSLQKRDFSFHACTVAKLEFEALVGLDKAEEAAAAILKHYNRNPNVLRHVPFERLIEGGLSGRWPTLRKFVFWPILTYLNNGSEQDIYEAVDDLLIQHGCTSPLEIADGTIPCADEELRIILRDVIVPDVIARGALWCRTASERRILRTRLLQKLYAISLPDQAFVVDELSRLEQARLLEIAYRNVEGPKFHLNFIDLNRAFASLFEGIFARYCEHRDYEENGGRLATDTDLLTLAVEGARVNSSAEKKRETSDFVLRYMGIDIFNAYILDPTRGINASLGTRIRHGSLDNQIRRVFGARALLAFRNVDGNYQCESSLAARLDRCPSEKRKEVENAYFQFTASITALLDDLISSKLRIKVPDFVISLMEKAGLQTRELRTSEGLLDYSDLYSDETFNRLNRLKYASVAAFLAEAERVFALASNAAFSNVRSYFEREVSDAVYSSVAALDQAICTVLPDSSLRGELRADILSAKNEFSQDLKIIQNWFGATEDLEAGVGSLEEAMLMACRVVDFASNGKIGTLDKGGFEDENLKADVGMLMYDALSILLRNVVQHSGIEYDQRVSYEHHISPDWRKLVIENRVATAERCEELVKKAKDAISRPYDEWVLGTSPGGTGFSRIRRLLKQAGWTKVEIEVNQLDHPVRFRIAINYTR